MKKITKELLKQRSEHNDGNLDTLKEITLHQFDIEKIECLDIYCKRLEILLLQNNLIGKIENLNKLKELRYLNLALNNIKRIENLSGCECLMKLDLTVNFIEDLLSVESLKENLEFRELYLVGNPCTQIDGYREFIIHTLPQLTLLDGREVEKSERIRAAQRYPEIKDRLMKDAFGLLAGENKQLNITTTLPETDMTQLSLEEIDEKRKGFNNVITQHDPETRVRIAKEVDLLRNGPAPKSIPKPERTIEMKNGRIMQKNEGKYEFKWQNTTDMLILVVGISQYLDTSHIDVNVQRNYIIVSIKNKVLQLVLDEDVVPEDCICERSKLTGDLSVSMLKAKSSMKNIQELYAKQKQNNATNQRDAFDNAIKKQEEPRLVLKTKLESLSLGSKTPIVRKDEGSKTKIQELKYTRADMKEKSLDDSLYEGEEYSDIPPLC